MTGMMRDMRTFSSTGRRFLALLATGLLVVGLSACGGDDDDDDSASTNTTAASSETTAADDGGGTADAGADVTIDGFSFSEGATVAASAEIVVDNKDGVTHTFTSDDDAWESIEIGGDSESKTAGPAEPGEYKFHCEIHKSMTGTLTVE
jgi:plastocyanin